jgi:hypothetical protein
MIAQVASLLESFAKRFDLLDIVNLEHLCVRRRLEEQSHKNGPLRVCVYTATGISLCECGEEEGCALGWFEVRWRAEVCAVFEIELLGEFEHVDVFGEHELFLHAGRREVD